MSDPTAPTRPKTLPELKKDFYKARRPEFPAPDGGGIVSKQKIEDLKAEAARQKPALVRNYDPPGTARKPKDLSQEIKRQEQRLEQTKGVAKDRFQRVAPKREV